MKRLFYGFISIVLSFSFFPLRVLAVNNTYEVYTGCQSLLTVDNYAKYYSLERSYSEVRYTIFKTENQTYVAFISKNDFLVTFWEYSGTPNSCPFDGASPTSRGWVYTDDGEYSYNYFRINSINISNYNVAVSTWNGNGTPQNFAYDLTFGSSSVDPGPSYGSLANVGYNTKIAGSGESAINNLDTVSWDPETDTSGNDISNMSVSIRAVPGKYSAASRQSLAEKLYSDFVLNTLEATVLDTVSASSGSFSVTWSDVIDELAIPFATISSLIDQDGIFIKNGWIYQVRLEGDGYQGEWQTVYTATSSGVQNDLTIIQSTTINQNLVYTITEINQLNNTNNNWYINETTINMSDYTEPSEGEKPWWAYLLEAIVSLINKIVDGIASIVGAIANLVGDIIDGILGLFTFDSFSVPDFSTHQQNIHDNSGIFGESIDILQTMNQTISNADSSAEPILYYPGIDLEGVEFIPEITINLNDYVEDLGLTQWHNLAYTCTDIFIWTTLIYTIYRKLIGVLKK